MSLPRPNDRLAVMPSQESLLTALEQITMGAVAVTARAVAESQPDLTLLQWRLLVVLSSEPKAASVTQLARRVGTGLPQASRLVARLRRKGLLNTFKDAADGRVTRVILTPDGSGLAHKVRGLRRDYLTVLLESDEAARLAIDEDSLHRIASVFGQLV